jgi:hypothetical protein
MKPLDMDQRVKHWLRFIGWTGEPIEMQALKVRRGNRYRGNYFAHAADVTTISKLLTEADEWDAPAVYYIMNAIDPAVATRAAVGAWHEADKGEATSDNDIATRRVLFVDVDSSRPKNTSATDAQLATTQAVAESIADRFAQIVAPESVGVGMSGNGATVMLALDSLPNSDESEQLIKGVLAALACVYDTTEVEIDPTVCDAKRLCPAWGTMKKKGTAGIPDRPHRRTTFECADNVARLGLGDLRRLLDELVAPLTADQLAIVDKAMGKRPSNASNASPPIERKNNHTQSGNDSPFILANACDVQRVADRLGLVDGDTVRCPGCGTSGDTSVVFIGNGLKCSHKSCANKGIRGGFRTPVDLAVEVKALSPIDAAHTICEWFGIEVAKREKKTNAASSSQHTEISAPPVSSVRAAADIPIELITWLWKGRIAGGMLNKLDGDPGVGKSTVLTDITARISSGRAMPGEVADVEPGGVLLISFEEHQGAVMVPRLKAAGADMSRVFIWNVDAQPFNVVESIPELLQIIRDNSIKLVVIDPIVAALPQTVNAHKDQEVRTALVPLSNVAATTGAAVLMVFHLNKSGIGSALHRGGGSIAFAAAARCVLTLGKNPDTEEEDGTRVLAVTKCNVGQHAKALRLQIVSALSPAPGVEAARVQWGDSCNITADNLVVSREEQTAIGSAVALLRGLLKDGPVLTKVAQEALRANGVTISTENRARARMGITAVQDMAPSGRIAQWRLYLPEQLPPAKATYEGAA